ncbi:MAG: alpha-ketoglutarate-dependent dioxygenase AlkB [Hyphomicrobiales bacterium]
MNTVKKSFAPSPGNKCLEGFRHIPGYISETGRAALREIIREIVAQAPLFNPVMPRTGKPFSVRMTSCGTLGWVSDKSGYRYQPNHPVTGKPWPQMPQEILRIWNELACYQHEPECCLVNFYRSGAKMGLHRDEDEQDFDAPVVSISLGDTALFRIGGLERKSPASSFKLFSGDVVVLGGRARLAYHGVSRIYEGTSTLLKNGGRVNLTLRRVHLPQ